MHPCGATQIAHCPGVQSNWFYTAPPPLNQRGSSLHLPLPAQLPQSTAAQPRELEQHRNRHREGTLQQQEPCYHPANSSAGTALVQATTLAQATREGPALQSQQQMKRFHPASSTPAAVSAYSGWMLFEGIHFIVSCLSAVPPESLTGC